MNNFETFIFKYTELGKTYLVEVEIIPLDNTFGNYYVFEEDGQQIILDVEEEVLENEWVKFIGGERLCN